MQHYSFHFEQPLHIFSEIFSVLCRTASPPPFTSDYLEVSITLQLIHSFIHLEQEVLKGNFLIGLLEYKNHLKNRRKRSSLNNLESDNDVSEGYMELIWLVCFTWVNTF